MVEMFPHKCKRKNVTKNSFCNFLDFLSRLIAKTEKNFKVNFTLQRNIYNMNVCPAIFMTPSIDLNFFYVTPYALTPFLRELYILEM